MSATAEPTTAPADEHGHGAPGHDDHGHHETFLAHHFESWQQQFDAGKLGVWLFLCQEVLFFSGLFVAYAVYRMLHPEVFAYADQFLSVPHGAANTLVLLFSSLTMAWGVRCAMLGQRTGLIVCVSITLFCAALFLGVKSFEYTEKYHAQLIWAGADPLQTSPGGVTEVPKTVLHLDPADRAAGEELEQKLTRTLGAIEFGVGVVGLLSLIVAGVLFAVKREMVGGIVTAAAIGLSAIGFVIGAIGSIGLHHWMHDASHETHATAHGEAAHGDVASHGESGAEANTLDASAGEAKGGEVTTGQAAEATSEEAFPGRPERLGTFFGIYYVMTGVHALHILFGMGFLIWLLVRAIKGHFTPNYFGPVDFVGLYWHLVDLVWIYLFPLLYLIG